MAEARGGDPPEDVPGGIKGVLVRVDEFQQRRPVFAFPVAVIKKFGDDKAGKLAALLAYYGFFSLFPLLLVFVAVLGFVLANNPDLHGEVVNSVFARFPFIGTQIRENVQSVRGSGAAVVVGLVVALWAGLGVMQGAQDAMNEVWGVPMKDRPNFLKSRLRSVIMLLILGVGIVLATLLAGVATAGKDRALIIQAAALVISLAVNFGLFLVAFRVLTVRNVSIGQLVPGAVLAAVGSLILQSVGGYILGNKMADAGETYGDFATVIVLLTWLSLQAHLTLFAAEVNVVRARRLWPRSLTQDPLAEADKEVLTQVAKVEERHPEQEIEVEFHDDGGEDDDEEPATGGEARTGSKTRAT
ncbi:MAG: YihY/virulence factor BrkB family protein [Actinomycetota bacterium]|nr:YihY/virulence factor BrkB family protein [Actinomycetota bacterium]